MKLIPYSRQAGAVLVAALCSVASVTSAHGPNLSSTVPQARAEHEDAQQAQQRALPAHRTLQRSSPSPLDVAYLADRDGMIIAGNQVTPGLASLAELEQRIFASSGDRFLQEPYDSSPLVLRRVAWKYPQEGAYWRTEAFNRNLDFARHERKLQSLFVFGKLAARTPNVKGSTVRWWYHVVPVTKIGNEVRVIDPALETARTLSLAQWLNRVVDRALNPAQERALLKIAICDPTTVLPDGACHNDTDGAPDTGMDEEAYAFDTDKYLKAEWQNELDLGRDPTALLRN